MAKFITSGKLCDFCSQGLIVAPVRPGVLTTDSKVGASTFGEYRRPAPTAWQPEQCCCANASPLASADSRIEPAPSAVVAGFGTPALGIISGVHAVVNSKRMVRPGNLHMVATYPDHHAGSNFECVKVPRPLARGYSASEQSGIRIERSPDDSGSDRLAAIALHHFRPDPHEMIREHLLCVIRSIDLGDSPQL